MSMLDPLIAHVAARAHLPPEKAEQAARAAIEFLDGRLPAPLGGNLRRMVERGGEGGGDGLDVGDLGGKLGGILGR